MASASRGPVTARSGVAARLCFAVPPALSRGFRFLSGASSCRSKGSPEPLPGQAQRQRTLGLGLSEDVSISPPCLRDDGAGSGMIDRQLPWLRPDTRGVRGGRPGKPLSQTSATPVLLEGAGARPLHAVPHGAGRAAARGNTVRWPVMPPAGRPGRARTMSWRWAPPLGRAPLH